MMNVWTLAVKEWKQFFYSVRAYVFGAMFLMMVGYFFAVALRYFNDMCLQASGFAMDPALSQALAHMNVNDFVLRSFFGNLAVIFLFVIPAATMGLFAEEKRRGTEEMLYTAPLTDVQLVAGKFAGGLLSVLTPLALTLVYMGFIAAHADAEWAPVWAGYAGATLLAAAFVALGLAASAATRSQIAAMALTFGILLMFYIIGWSAEMADFRTGQIIRYLSLTEHYENFSKGVIEIKDVVYFLSVTTFGLVLTHQLVASRRWKG